LFLNDRDTLNHFAIFNDRFVPSSIYLFSCWLIRPL